MDLPPRLISVLYNDPMGVERGRVGCWPHGGGVREVNLLMSVDDVVLLLLFFCDRRIKCLIFAYYVVLTTQDSVYLVLVCVCVCVCFCP